jgi:hypothetical protein
MTVTLNNDDNFQLKDNDDIDGNDNDYDDSDGSSSSSNNNVTQAVFHTQYRTPTTNSASLNVLKHCFQCCCLHIIKLTVVTIHTVALQLNSSEFCQKSVFTLHVIQ